MLTEDMLMAMNARARKIHLLGPSAYRQHPVQVGPFTPPDAEEVPLLMGAFIRWTNRAWKNLSAIELAAGILWRLGYIHPFSDGNGRTMRAAAYYAVCVKSGTWLQGKPTLPELLNAHRAEYIAALLEGNASQRASELDLTRLEQLIERLLFMQTGRRDFAG